MLKAVVSMTTRGGRTTGTVTTAWYGSMTMQNVKVEGDLIAFDLRNLNDKAHATRRWTARLDGDQVSLVGDAGYLYVNIDDGWQGKRDGNGVLQPNEKFEVGEWGRSVVGRCRHGSTHRHSRSVASGGSQAERNKIRRAGAWRRDAAGSGAMTQSLS